MKTKIFGLMIAAVATVTIFFSGISTNAQETPPPPDSQSQNSQTGSEPADALPPDVAANAALVEVINLSQGGVSEDVIQNYINNVQTPFNLTASQLIYLKDIGIPDSDVIAMQQRDAQLGQAAPPPAQTAAPTAPTTVVSDDGFYDALAPYGNWVVISGYGRCWRPAVVVYDSSWQPYCDHGHWVWTDDGWYWYSDYSWGWATFHYGRWFDDARYGWCWYPDTVWGPSWVCWRYSDDYCGWAPLPPHCEYREGIGLFYNGVAVTAGFDFGLSIGAFTFVATHDFCDPHPWQHRVDRAQVTQIYNHTTVINNFGGHNTTIINNGIPVDRIATATHTQIKQVTIRDSNTPLRSGERFENGNTLVVNRPHIQPTALQSPNNPRTIPSPTTGRPMQVPPPNENRTLPQHNQTPVQMRSYPTATPRPQNQPQPNANARQNENQNDLSRFGSTLPQTQTRNYPSVENPAPSRTTPTTPQENQFIQPNHQRSMSPRMTQQQPMTPPVERQTPRDNGGNYNDNAQPEPRVEAPQPEPRVYQPAQPQAQQPAPQQNYQQPQRQGRDRNGQQ